MAFIPYYKNPEAGDKVKLLKNIKVYNGVFEVGTIVEVIKCNNSCLAVKDEFGNKAYGIEYKDVIVIG